MIYYQSYGDNNNKTLVLLHSGGMAGIEWQPQIEMLAKHFRLLVPDLPGHGKSIVPEGKTLSISMMAESVVELLKHERVDKAHLLGSSMGGAVALWMALKFPDVVDKLIIYRIGYDKNEETHAQTRSMADPDYWRQYGMHDWLSKLHIPQGDANSWENVIAGVSSVLDPKTSDHNHSLADLSTIGAETLLIAGDSDPLISVQTLLNMREVIPHCALWIMPKATHITASNTWRAKAFAEEIIRFLR
ncbi:MAG: alpha/beta hydrolase [Gammaproteobacteria bacterium]|nr:MAG: alpha/beta hydrolase [Gammaproteobacteria bacterium]